MLRQVSLMVTVSLALTACGGSDNKKSSSSSSAPASVAASSMAASVAPSSVAPSSVAPSSVAPSSVAPSSVAPSSVAPSSVAPSSVAASSEAASSMAPSSVAASSSSAASSSAPSTLSFTFESDADDKAYGSFGWSENATTTAVKTIASITGLPANGSSTKVLKVIPTNYNAFAKFQFTLPSGKTLADYNVMLDLYFPYASLGLTTSENYYKDLMLFAGTTISGTPDNSNAAFQSTRANTAAWNEVDLWLPLTLTLNATKAAALSGTFELAVGINRPAATAADGYYIDNIRLEAK